MQDNAAHEGYSSDDTSNDFSKKKSTAGADDDNVSRGASRQFKLGKGDACRILEHGAVIYLYEVFLRISEILFHLLVTIIADETAKFDEQMKKYKSTESLPRRLWQHYIVKARDGFCEELWCRITLV